MLEENLGNNQAEANKIQPQANPSPISSPDQSSGEYKLGFF